jgi:cysteine-rich repeat protein
VRISLALGVVACALAACVQSSLVPCGDLVCPVGDVCTAGGCASPADVAACDGLIDGTGCRSAAGGAGTCQSGACRTGLCGNGAIDVGEVCDDGNQVSGDGCRGDCKKIEMCGDGQLDVGEQCDDGNNNPADGCDACKRTQWMASAGVGMEVGATGTALANPGGVAFDGAGRIYFADTANHRIRRIELDGSVTTVAGTGDPGYAGDGGHATSAELASPAAVAVDGEGRVFIADTDNDCIRAIDLDGTISTIAGSPGVAGDGGDGGAAILAQLSSPHGVAIDGLGRVVVADTGNNRVRRIDIDGTISSIAGTGASGFSGDGGAATSAELAAPAGVAVDDLGRVLVADTGNARVRRIDTSGAISTVAGTATSGYGGDGGAATSAMLSTPVAVAVDPSGRIAIADAVNQVIRLVAADGTISTIAGTGTPGYAGDGGAATSAELAFPIGVALDATGQIAIGDTANQRVRLVAAGGTIATVAGTGAFGSGGDGQQATSAQLSDPFDVATDAMGRIYIVDTNDHRVRRIELDGRLTTVAGTGLAGFSGDGGPAASAQLFDPEGVAVDAMGRVYIADAFNNRVRRVELDGTIDTIAGNGVQGYGGDGGPATSAKLSHPNGIAFDASGRVYIADTYNNRVRRIELDGTIDTVAGTGASGYNGDGVQAASAELSFPYRVAIDPNGLLVIADTGNQRIRHVAADGTISTIAGDGTPGFSGDGGPATAAALAGPYGIAFDSMGRLLVADNINNRIRRIATDGTISTIAGTGGQGGDGDAGPASAADIASPIGLIVDGAGRVVFCDSRTDRVRRIELDGTIDTIAGLVDPEDIGPVASARLVDTQAIALGSAATLSAGGASGTLEAVVGGRVAAVAGRYPQSVATGALARFRTAEFGTVGGVAIDPATGLIYVTETSANRLHVITPVDPANPATWTIAPLANAAGTAGFADGASAIAQLRAPTGLFLDGAANRLYIADTGNHAIRALDLTTGTVTTVVNTSHRLGFGGDGGPATAALLYQPAALARCPDGDLFIADTGNNRVRRVDGTGAISTVLGDGVPASSGEGTPARTFPVDAPRGIACDAYGNVFVTSSTAVRLLPATDAGLVDGAGPVTTIYGTPPRTAFPASITGCLTGIGVASATRVEVGDACTGLLVDLDRVTAP